MFHSAALFGSAIYLLAMGSVGYYLRYLRRQLGHGDAGRLPVRRAACCW
jgi:hypothetical protein